MADDEIAAALVPTVKAHANAVRLEEAGNMSAALVSYAVAAKGIPRLLAAVEKALEHHRRLPLYGNAATEGEPGNCPHHPDSDLHFEDSDAEAYRMIAESLRIGGGRHPAASAEEIDAGMARADVRAAVEKIRDRGRAGELSRAAEQMPAAFRRHDRKGG